MKASVILAHPWSGSFNHALYATVCGTLRACGTEVFAHDLYAEGFSPLLTAAELGSDSSSDPQVRDHAAELLEAALLVFIHPNWWGQPPAILKGWIDRVVRPPYAYDFPSGDAGGGIPLGKLAGKSGLVFNTSNTEKSREEEYFLDPLEAIWGRCVFGFCGITRYRRRMFWIVADSTPEERQEWLEEAARLVREAVGSVRSNDDCRMGKEQR